MPQRGAGERTPVIARKEDGTKELCEVFTDNDTNGGASKQLREMK